MLSLDSFKLENFATDFWHLPVTKDFDQPEYYIGQTVFNVIKVKGGEILHPVKVFGAYWTGMGWEYLVELEAGHPKFEHENSELIWQSNWQLEAM